MARTSWSSEPGSNLPQVRIDLDTAVYNGLEGITHIVGRPDYQGDHVNIVFMSETGARDAMREVLRRLRSMGAIHGYFHDNHTGASTN